MVRFKKTVAIASLVLSSFYANANGFSSPDSLTIGSDMTYYPYEYVKNDQPQGFDIEFMTQVAKLMHRKPVFMDTRFANLVVGLMSGKYDIMSSSLYITPQRLQAMDMIPYLKGGQAIVMLASASKNLTSMAMLCGKKVATMQGSFAAKQMRVANDSLCADSATHQKIIIEEYPSNPEATRALFSHAADAQLTDAALSKGLTDRFKNKLKVTSDELLTPVLIGIGVRKGDTEVREALTRAITEYQQTPGYQQLLERYGFSRLTPQDIATLMPK